ncbi:hypothetical protein NHX12_017719 [Muraenolepis orangiensis]|uniref:Uncharacterized protein n=1 Tax=Muraenolepis orangiensis TaxID=630683 RepID=A0A9Q0IXZ9_9TELE|nr:hypothetical protein NHX12_017719 [Muraenolepis orangiensis]
MEKDFQSAPKRFWQTIRRLRRGKRGSIQAVYSKGGTLLTSTEEVIGRWKEHFEELLNPTTPSMGVAFLRILQDLCSAPIDKTEQWSGAAAKHTPPPPRLCTLHNHVRGTVKPT